MKKIAKIAVGIFAIALIAINADVLNAQVSLPGRPVDEAVASWGKQYWKDGLRKICCDKSHENMPCLASTTDC